MKTKILLTILLTFSIFQFGIAYANEEILIEEPSSSIAEDTVTPEPPPIITEEIVPPLLPSYETILIRNGETIVYEGQIELPLSGTITISDSEGISRQIPSTSVLGVLYAVDQTIDSFSISNIQYYSSFNSLYLKCIESNSTGPLCDNWQYVVNGTSPWTSMDSTILSGGEILGFYFGSPRKVTIEKNSVTTDESFTATAFKYDYLNNTWLPLSGVTLGITQPNESDPFSPFVVETKPVNEGGLASFTIVNEGTYTIGISEDYYFPAYSITVTKPVSSSGGGGGGWIPQTRKFDIKKATDFLISNQNADGSFGGSDMYTDWAGIAFSALGISGIPKDSLLMYLEKNPKNLTSLTDNERRSISLLALGQNPYNFGGIDYISPVVESFDGKQFGDPSLINDDIFALFPLLSAGYTKEDAVITSDLNFILSKQFENGSFENSVDMTSVAISLLSVFKGDEKIDASILKGEQFIKNSQSDNGGFENVYTTSWAVQAMKARGSSWIKNSISPEEYIATFQEDDGGVLPVSESIQNRIWATSYALPAILGKSWPSLMTPVAKKIIEASKVVEVSKDESVVEKISTSSKKIIVADIHTSVATALEPIPINLEASVSKSNIEFKAQTLIFSAISIITLGITTVWFRKKSNL